MADKSSDTPMYPVGDIAPPNNLQRGDVVFKVNNPNERGVVLTDPGEATPASWALGTNPNSVAISNGLSYAICTITDNHDRQWQKVERDEQTARERVLAASLSWRPLSERSPEAVAESGPADDDTVGWHLLLALLPTGEYHRALDPSEWPTSTDLAMRVAEIMDRRSVTTG